MSTPKANFVETLRRMPLFSGLSDGELTLVGSNVIRVHFQPGGLIFAEGDLCRDLLVVEDGEVRVFKAASNGRQQLLTIERKGSSLAEVAVYDGGLYPASAEAITKTDLLRLPAETFRNMCSQNPDMALKVFKVLGRRLRHLVTLIEELSFSTVRVRLIAHFIRLAEETAPRNSRSAKFQLKENNEELAIRLGTVRELISRNLGRLHGDGLIRMEGRTVNVPDIEALRAEADRKV
jgi:CRP-like cAMP-binding protein